MTLKSALEILEETSRTFYLPIVQLPAELKEAVTSAYLCMRAIDEIEDHLTLSNSSKAELLHQISTTLQEGTDGFAPDALSHWGLYEALLPEVTLRLREWATLAPVKIAPRIWDTTAAMAARMAYWADQNWEVLTEADLDRYTFSVAGAVGLLLSDLWSWYDGTRTDRIQAISFGRGLQAVNILRNRAEDLARGVDFLPTGWEYQQMVNYARRNLALADVYTQTLPAGAIFYFCRIPLTLAHATLNALEMGEVKLSRSAVISLTEQVLALEKPSVLLQ